MQRTRRYSSVITEAGDLIDIDQVSDSYFAEALVYQQLEFFSSRVAAEYCGIKPLLFRLAQETALPMHYISGPAIDFTTAVQKNENTSSERFIHYAAQKLLSSRKITDFMADGQRLCKADRINRRVAIAAATVMGAAAFLPQAQDILQWWGYALLGAADIGGAVLSVRSSKGRYEDTLAKIAAEAQPAVIQKWALAACTAPWTIAVQNRWYDQENNPAHYFSITPERIEDISAVTRNKVRYFVERATAENLSEYVSGFEIHIHSRKRALAGTYLRMWAYPRPNHDYPGGANRRREKKAKLAWGGLAQPNFG